MHPGVDRNWLTGTSKLIKHTGNADYICKYDRINRINSARSKKKFQIISERTQKTQLIINSAPMEGTQCAHIPKIQLHSLLMTDESFRHQDQLHASVPASWLARRRKAPAPSHRTTSKILPFISFSFFLLNISS
jgi:hypothetical protein